MRRAAIRGLSATLLAVMAAALPAGAAVAERGGYVPPVIFESSQPRPQWSQAERSAAGGPFGWLERLFSGGGRQENAPAGQPSNGTAAHRR